MGAWSHESFGNDYACDWAFELAGTNDLNLVESALDTVLAVGEEYLEEPKSSQAIAAAEVIARLLGNFGTRDSYSELVDRWVTKVKLAPSPALILKAQVAIDRILREPSELLEAWNDGDEDSMWVDAVKELKARIHA